MPRIRDENPFKATANYQKIKRVTCHKVNYVGKNWKTIKPFLKSIPYFYSNIYFKIYQIYCFDMFKRTQEHRNF